MKKLIFILFLFPLLLFSQTHYYVSTSGNNGNPGTLELPWRNIWYACSQVTGGNDINVMSGTYAEGTQWTLASGVSIYAMGGVRVESSYAATSQPLVKGESTNGWLHPTYIGHQEINGITFDGNNITYAAIHINFRHYVKIVNCHFIDFQYNAVTFYGMPMTSWTETSVFEPDRTMPNYFCVGNEISNCTFTNCTQGTGNGQINIGQQDGIKIFNNDIYQPLKGSGGNCGGIKFKADGYNKNTDMHHNSIIVDLNGGNSFNFSIEMWYELGGCKYYNNVFQGGTDFDAAVKGSSTYSIWFHHNEVGYPTHQQSNHYGFNLEASCSDVIIEKNYFHHVRAGIYVSQIWPILTGSGRNYHPYTNELNNIRISCNIFSNIGRLAGGGDWEPVYGVYFGRSSRVVDITTLDNIYVDNNVIECTAVTPYSYYVTGIWLPNSNTVVNNLRVRNNIIIGFAGGTNFSAPIFGTGLYGSNDINDLYIQKNLCYGNGNSNNTLLVSGYAPDPYTYDTHIKLDPLFETDYHLQEGSPAIGVGMWIDEVPTDYEDKDFYDPRSLGVFEIGTAEPEPEPEPEPGTGQIWTDGLGNIITDGFGNVLKK